METKRRAALYARVSTEEQGGPDTVSLKTQLDACRKKAEAKGWVISEAHVVEEIHSGTDLRWQGTKLMWLVEEARRGRLKS